MSYNFDYLDRFKMMLNDEQFNRLINARIIVFGAGGVGGAVCHFLVRAGIQHLTVVDYDKIDAVQSSDDVLFINEAFFPKQPELSITVEGKYLLGDVFDCYLENPIPDYDYSAHSVTAADARLVMRFAAGIEDKNQSKRFYFTADMDLDGKITSADARLILRTAAGLEDEKYIKYDCMNMWYDFGNAE